MLSLEHLPRRFIPAGCCCAVAVRAADTGLLRRQWRADEQARREWEEDKAQKKAMELHHCQMEGSNTCGPAPPPPPSLTRPQSETSRIGPSPVCRYHQDMPGTPWCPALTCCAASRYEMCLRLGEIMNDLEEHDWYNKLDGQDRTPSWVRAHFVLETELVRSRASRASLPPWQLAQVLPPTAPPPSCFSLNLLLPCLFSGDHTLDSTSARLVSCASNSSTAGHGPLEDRTTAVCQ